MQSHSASIHATDFVPALRMTRIPVEFIALWVSGNVLTLLAQQPSMPSESSESISRADIRSAARCSKYPNNSQPTD